VRASQSSNWSALSLRTTVSSLCTSGDISV
jgi:hypothetical protein